MAQARIPTLNSTSPARVYDENDNHYFWGRAIVKRDSSPNLTTLPPLTRHQQTVLEVLRQQSIPLSAQQLYGLLRQQKSIGLATVYRALDALKLHGFIKSQLGLNGEAFYSSVDLDQHYLTCLHCGQSLPLEHCPLQGLEGLESHWPGDMSFQVYYHTLEFFGICETCTQQTT